MSNEKVIKRMAAQASEAICGDLPEAATLDLVGQLELLQHHGLSWLARSLFAALVVIARRGADRTTYADLASLLQDDYGSERATVKRLRTAVDQLAKLGFIALDRQRNKANRALFFRVSVAHGAGDCAVRERARVILRRHAGQCAAHLH